MKKMLIIALMLSLGVGILVLVAERGRIWNVLKKEEPVTKKVACPMAQETLKKCEEQQAEDLESKALRGEWVTSGGATDPYYLRREECMARYHDECNAEQEKSVGAVGTPTQELESMENIQAVEDF